MKKGSKLDEYLNSEFHAELSDIMFNANLMTFDFVTSDDHLLVDARNYPEFMGIELVSPSVLSSVLGENLFREYAELVAARQKVMVYLYRDDECHFYVIGNDGNHELERSDREIEKDITGYIDAYRNGLIRECMSAGEPRVFAIINGIASNISVEEAIEVLQVNNRIHIPQFIEMSQGKNGNNLTFLYINDKERTVWYDALEDDVYMELKRELGI